MPQARDSNAEVMASFFRRGSSSSSNDERGGQLRTVPEEGGGTGGAGGSSRTGSGRIAPAGATTGEGTPTNGSELGVSACIWGRQGVHAA